MLALFNLLRGLDTQLRLPLAALAHAADDKASNPLRRTCADSVFVFSIRASIADTSQHEHRAASGRRGGGSPGAASKSCSMSTLFTCESVHFRTSALLELRSADLFVPLLKSLQKKRKPRTDARIVKPLPGLSLTSESILPATKEAVAGLGRMDHRLWHQTSGPSTGYTGSYATVGFDSKRPMPHSGRI